MKITLLKSNLLVIQTLIVLSISSCSSTDLSGREPLIEANEAVLGESIISSQTDSRETTSIEEVGTIGEEPEKVQVSKAISPVSGITALQQEGKISPEFEDTKKISVSIDNMTIPDFIHYVFGELLDLNYVISSDLQNDTRSISLNLSGKITKKEIYRASEQLLENHSVASLRKDRILYFEKKNKDRKYKDANIGIGRRPGDIPETNANIVQVIPYVYTNSRSLSNVIKKLTGVKVQIDSKRKIVIAEGSRAEIIDIMRVLEMLDVPSATGKQIRLINLAYISPDTLISKLDELLENDGFEVGNDGDVTFVSIPRLNAITVYAVSLEAIERVELWSKKLDIPVAGDEPQFFVYRPMFNKAVDLNSSLGPMIDNILNEAKRSNDAPPENGSPVASATSSVSSAVDEVQNSLIFYTTADRYRKIKQLLEKLDKLPGQVILDMAIAEVVLSDQVGSGIDWFYNSEGFDEGSSLLAADWSAGGDSSGSFKLSALSGNWRVAMNFLDQKTSVDILAKPFVIVKDGESASINSGDQIPTLVQSSTSAEGENITETVQYVSTGIQVSVTPTINADGLINLEVAMTSSNAQPGGGLSPTITNRNITTNIFSANGQTVALGGLIQQSRSNSGDNIPGFSNIPGLGDTFFSSYNDKRARTELIMMITTKIVRNVSEVDEFGSKLLELYTFGTHGEAEPSKSSTID